MNFARKTFAILMAGALTAGLMAGCDKLPGDSSSGASSAASSSAASTDSFDYSAPFDENGLWKDVTALDYVTRMDGTTGQELNDLYARMVGAQQ